MSYNSLIFLDKLDQISLKYNIETETVLRKHFMSIEIFHFAKHLY